MRGAKVVPVGVAGEVGVRVAVGFAAATTIVAVFVGPGVLVSKGSGVVGLAAANTPATIPANNIINPANSRRLFIMTPNDVTRPRKSLPIENQSMATIVPHNQNFHP